MEETSALELRRRMNGIDARAERLRDEVRDLCRECEDVADLARNHLYEVWGVDPLVDDYCPDEAERTWDAYHESADMAKTLDVLRRIVAALV